MSIEAMKMALEALEEYQAKGPPFMSCDGAVAVLRAAIEQAEKQEPNEDYERGFVDGMQEQMKRSVDRAVNAINRAVNATCKREWVGLTEIEICDIEVAELTSASSETFSFAKAIEAKLKERNEPR